MKGHSQKKVPDRVLKGMILKTIFESKGLLTSQEIHDYISSHTFYFESPELNKFGRPLFSGKYTYNNLYSIRKELTYCRRAGYVKKVGEKRPFLFELTDEGILHAKDPFVKYRVKQERMIEQSFKYAESILKNDEKVDGLAEKKRVEKCKTCRDAKSKALKSKNTVRPIKNIIKVEMKNGDVKEIEMTREGEVRELEELKKALIMSGKSPNAPSTILTLQNENEELKKLLGHSGIELGKAQEKLERKERKKEKDLIRNLDRLELAEHYYVNGLYLDEAFFDYWQGNYRAVLLERIMVWQELLHKGKIDIIGTNSDEWTRRQEHIKEVLTGEEIEYCQIRIVEIQNSGILIDSPGMIAPKTLRF